MNSKELENITGGSVVHKLGNLFYKVWFKETKLIYELEPIHSLRGYRIYIRQYQKGIPTVVKYYTAYSEQEAYNFLPRKKLKLI